MFQLALILAATVALGVHGQTSNYSALGLNDTMKIPYPPVDPSCNQLISSVVSAADRTTILNKHNELRSRVAKGLETRGSPGPQPPAANMRKLIWNNGLAIEAQRRASKYCIAEDSWSKAAISSVGQNIYITYSSAAVSFPNWAAAINSWFDEVTQFDKSGVSSYTSQPGTAQYSRVAWANTYMVGCGFAKFNHAWNSIDFLSVYVCNYSPAGNVIGSPMYKIGTACSQCPAGTTCSSVAERLCKI